MSSEKIKKSDFVQSLEKGLKVIAIFDDEHREMTLTEVAKKVGLTRANARRILLTLQYLDYVKYKDGKLFSLTAKVLCLGYSFLSSLSFKELAQPYIQALAMDINESCSMSVLDGKDIVYVARFQTKRIMTISLSIGSRLPLHATSMGRVLMSGMVQKDLEKILDKIDLEAYTPHTITSKQELIKSINIIKQRGWALADQELEIGVRSIACPVKDKEGKTIAALNISGHASRVTKEEMIDNYLPPLQKTVEEIESALHKL